MVEKVITLKRPSSFKKIFLSLEREKKMREIFCSEKTKKIFKTFEEKILDEMTKIFRQKFIEKNFQIKEMNRGAFKRLYIFFYSEKICAFE